MKTYNDILLHVLEKGIPQSDRTGVGTIFVPGYTATYDLREGFPAVTTKQLAFKSVVGELVGFLRGYDNAAQFRELGCKIWDQNANENQAWLHNPNRRGVDDLNRIYGVQWTQWNSSSGGTINQVETVLNGLYNNPNDRRLIISGWRPDEMDQMALPPCHVLYHFIADTTNNELHLLMYQRSVDLFLGAPFNIASASCFLTLMANLTGFKPATFTHMMGNVHIYNNHMDQVALQLSRTPYPSPTLKYTGPVFNGVDKFDATIFDQIEPHHFELVGYQRHESIKAPMAV